MAVQFPSELRFVSFLQYSPKGTAKSSADSRELRDAVKNDGTVNGHAVLPLAAKRIAQKLDDFPFLADCFGSDVVLIPVPRNRPFKEKDALWPTLRICEQLVDQGLGQEVRSTLVRTEPVLKASTHPHERRDAVHLG